MDREYVDIQMGTIRPTNYTKQTQNVESNSSFTITWPTNSPTNTILFHSAARLQPEFWDETLDERTRKPIYPNAVAIKKVTNVFSKKILAKRALREIKLLNHFRGIRNVGVVVVC